MYIPLDIAKKHLNLEPSFTDDDEYILVLIDAAEQAVLKHCNEDLSKLEEKGWVHSHPDFQRYAPYDRAPLSEPRNRRHQN